MITKSSLEEVELSNGISVYVQLVSGKASLSFEGPQISANLWLRRDELEQIATKIDQVLSESLSESQSESQDGNV